MEELANYEKARNKRLTKVRHEMQCAFVNSEKPLKDILFHFNKGIQKGFDLELFYEGFKSLRQAVRGRGLQERAFEDYTNRELDVSWRMQTMSDQFKTALDERMVINPHVLGKTLNEIGELGFKDIDIIQKSFEKLN